MMYTQFDIQIQEASAEGGVSSKQVKAYQICIALKEHFTKILRERLEESLFEATENEEVIQQQRRNMTQSLAREQQLQQEIKTLRMSSSSSAEVEDLRARLAQQEMICRDLTQKLLDAMAQVSRKEEDIRVLRGMTSPAQSPARK